MSNNTNRKIVFVAFHTISVSKQYWQSLKDRTDCWWATFSPQVYAELKEMGCAKIYFRNMLVKEFKPDIFYRVISKINLFYLKKTIQKRIKKMIDELAPDILIANTTQFLSKYNPNNQRIMKAQVFHSIPYKKYCLIPETLKYDLVLFPGQYHREEMRKRFNVDDINKLKVVGWPRLDNFANKKFGSQDRSISMKKLGLNPEFKNVLYAPTHNSFYGNGLFPKAFGSTVNAFEEFCRRIKELNVNLIIKLHSVSHKLVMNPRLHRIAEKYDVHFGYKNSKEHTEIAAENFLWITDVLISDISGIITDYLFLNRPIVYIEPDKEDFRWEEADLPKEFRAGDVVKMMDELVVGVKKSLKDPDKYKFKREEILQKIFYKLDGQSSKRASDAILAYYKEFSK